MDNTLGKLITTLRLAKGMTLQDLAHHSDVPRSTLRDIEAGRVNHPRATTLSAIAEVLGVTVDDLTQRPQPQPSSNGTQPTAGVQVPAAQLALLITKWGEMRDDQRLLTLGFIDLLLGAD
ncbi:MAG: helix-turn-helix transcriptional regulator [Chloroflexota bacterium]